MARNANQDRLTEDERRFLESSTAMKRKREIQRQNSEESRDVRPGFPVITMSVIAVLGVAFAVAVFLVFNSFKPYVEAADQFMSSGAVDGSSTAVETARGLSTMYGHRGTALMIILIVVVVIEAIIYFFWVARYDAWRKRERIRIRNRKRRKAARRRQQRMESQKRNHEDDDDSDDVDLTEYDEDDDYHPDDEDPDYEDDLDEEPEEDGYDD